MIKEAHGFGNTIDEAREEAMLKLAAPEGADVQFEVVATPKKKTLGLFGGNKAEVKAYIELPDEKPAKKAKKAEKAVKTEVPQKPAKQPKAKKETELNFPEPVDSGKIDPSSKAAIAVNYIRTVLDSLHCGEVKIKVAEKENAALILLNGEDVGVIIGRRGETLDALQYLAGLAANNGGGYYKVTLNIGNYREKREETLKSLAARVSAQVLKVGKCRALEPMNPYERRIIHTAVQDIEGVYSGSFGEGENRRVVIGVEGTELYMPRHSGSRERGNDRRRGGNDRRPSVAVVSTPSREPKKDTDIPLYGKIN